MRTECKKRKNSSRVPNNSRSKTRSPYGTTSADAIPKTEDKQSPKANDGIEGNLLPARTPWIVALCTFVIRVYYVTNPASWWVLHPDEVFQSMDVAHSEAYGYGFRPFEFISPAKGDNLSHYEIKETILEMFAMRSPIYPQLLALVAKLFNTVGMADQPFMLWRIFHVLVTSSLPLAASLFVKASGQSLDVAALSSILIGASSHLNVFGTHTIINSFVSPFIFLSLSLFVSLLRISQEKATIDTPFSRSNHKDDHKHIKCDAADNMTPCNFTNCNENSFWTVDSAGMSIRRRNSRGAQHGIQTFDQTSPIPFPTFSDKKLSSNRMRHVRDSSSSDSGFDNRSTSSTTSSDGGHSDGEMFDENESSDKEMLISNSTYCQPVSKCYSFQDKTINAILPLQFLSNFSRCKDGVLGYALGARPSLNTTFYFGTGFLLGISMYLRPDSCLFVVVVVLAHLNFNIKFFFSIAKCTSAWIFIFGSLVSILLGIADDCYFYQELVISPWQWFKFNVLSTLASRLFGTSGATFYVSKIFFGNVGVGILSVLFISFFIISLLSYIMAALDPSQKSSRAICKQNGFDDIVYQHAGQKFTGLTSISAVNTRYSCSSILFVLIFTSFGHKEERFLHDILVLFFMIISEIVIRFVQIGKFVFSKRLILYCLISSYCLSQWQAMPDNNEYGVNQCLHFVSKQNDVRGLFLEHTFSSTFSYSLIHQDIPLLTNLQKDFQEFDKSAIFSSNRSCFIQGYRCKASFVSMSSVTNIIHSSNSQGIVRYLLKNHQKYNYAIVSSSKEFFQPAYTKVYTTESYSVWRFSELERHKTQLHQMVQKMIPDASQHAIEEYEAERLKQLGQFWAALDRFKSAKENSPNTTKILASMAFCFKRIGMIREARQAFTECLTKGNRRECEKGSEARVRDAGSIKMT